MATIAANLNAMERQRVEDRRERLLATALLLSYDHSVEAETVIDRARRYFEFLAQS